MRTELPLDQGQVREGDPAVLSTFALVHTLSFDAFQLSGTSGVIPFPFRYVVLHRRRALKADESFVAILHRIHVITVTMRGVSMNVVALFRGSFYPDAQYDPYAAAARATVAV
jgi:hypothetical protein